MKAYGRAPTFLALTGYEQVRSIVAEIAGDSEAAARVELVLPETGACSLSPVEAGSKDAGCCGGHAKLDVSACCVADEDAKRAGEAGCGCGATAVKRSYSGEHTRPGLSDRGATAALAHGD